MIGAGLDDRGPRSRGTSPGSAPGAVLPTAASARAVSLALAFALVAGFSLPASPLEAQEIGAVLGRDTARVGDVVAVAVRVVVEPGERVAWPDTLPLAGAAAENATGVRERVDTLPDGRLARTGLYAVTPWRTGEVELPAVGVQVVGGEESPRSRRVELPALTVVSVLPPDTSGLEPRPAKGVLGANWAWGPILLLALLIAAVAAVLIWWWRRRRVEEEEPVPLAPLIPPRERALAALQEAREAGLLERGEMKEFYTRVSEAVRGYAAALDGAWGDDLTTTELLSRFRADVGVTEAGRLREVLAPADQVKFARREPDPETAVAEWESARAWVRGFDWPPPAIPEEAA